MRKFWVPALLVGASIAFSLVAFEIALRVIGYSAPVWFLNSFNNR